MEEAIPREGSMIATWVHGAPTTTYTREQKILGLR